MRKFIQALGVAAMVALSAPLAAQDKVNISIATGGTGGVYYPLGGGMAAAFSKYVPGMDATGRSHRRLGRQPQADRQRQTLHRADHGRRDPGRLQGRG